GSMPVKMRVGTVRKLPPPATEFCAPAISATTKSRMAWGNDMRRTPILCGIYLTVIVYGGQCSAHKGAQLRGADDEQAPRFAATRHTNNMVHCSHAVGSSGMRSNT